MKVIKWSRVWGRSTSRPILVSGIKLSAILLLAAAGIYAIGDAVLAPTPTPENPGFVDAVLASRPVIVTIRLAIIFAGVFVVASVVASIAQGRWWPDERKGL